MKKQASFSGDRGILFFPVFTCVVFLGLFIWGLLNIYLPAIYLAILGIVFSFAMMTVAWIACKIGVKSFGASGEVKE